MAGFTGKKKDKLGRETCWQDGKRVPCPKEGKTPKGKKTAAASAEDVRADIKTTLARGATPADVERIAAAMAKLSQNDINALKKELSVKIGGKKEAQARVVAEQALTGKKTTTPKASGLDDVRADIKTTLARGPTPADVDRISAAMAKLSQQDINAIKKELAIKVGGKKEAQAKTIAEQALATAKPKEEPQKKEPAPKAERPKPAPKASGTLDPDLSPTGRRAVMKAVQGLQKSKDLTPEQRKEFFDATQRVIKNMPPKAQERMAQIGFNYFGDKEKLVEGIVDSFPPEKQSKAREKLKVPPAGVYSPVHDGVFVDGSRVGTSTEAAARKLGRAVYAHEIYAHEMAHGLDGKTFAHSAGPEWQAAWKAELQGGQLTEYAAGEAREGWAEFGRLLFDGEHDLSQVKQKYPKCWAVFDKLGFAPEVKVKAQYAAKGVHLDDIFSNKVVLDKDGTHADMLIEDKEKYSADFEGKHPRDEDGQFTEGQDQQAKSKPPASRSGPEGQEKEERKGGRRKGEKLPPPGPVPPREEPVDEEHEQRLFETQTQASQSLYDAVQAGTITQDEADRRLERINDVINVLSVRALERFHANTAGYQWHATQADVNAAYEAMYRPLEGGVGAFYDVNTGLIHLADNHTPTYAEEVAHAIDGPNFEISNSPEWREAYHHERGRLSNDAYPTSERYEWWGNLMRIALSDPASWELIRRRLPRSDRVMRRYL